MNINRLFAFTEDSFSDLSLRVIQQRTTRPRPGYSDSPGDLDEPKTDTWLTAESLKYTKLIDSDKAQVRQNY